MTIKEKLNKQIEEGQKILVLSDDEWEQYEASLSPKKRLKYQIQGYPIIVIKTENPLTFADIIDGKIICLIYKKLPVIRKEDKKYL